MNFIFSLKEMASRGERGGVGKSTPPLQARGRRSAPEPNVSIPVLSLLDKIFREN